MKKVYFKSCVTKCFCYTCMLFNIVAKMNTGTCICNYIHIIDQCLLRCLC